MSLLFSTAYLPPVKYILLAIQNGSILLDAHEHFVKQSYRSRSTIYGPNGKQDLIIPVVHTDLFTIPIKEVKIQSICRISNEGKKNTNTFSISILTYFKRSLE